MGISGFYFGLYLLSSLFSGGKKKAVEAPAAPAAASASSAIPSMADDDFEAWAKVEGNMAKYEASLEKWEPSA